jgi:hypothetical protein
MAPVTSGSLNTQNNDAWIGHIDGTETDTTDQTAAYNTTANAWTVTGYTLKTHQADNFTDTFLGNDGSSATATGTTPSGTDTLSANGTTTYGGSVTLDSLFTGDGKTYTLTQHQVVSSTVGTSQTLADIGNVTVALAFASGVSIGLGAPPAASGSETDKNNDTWNRQTTGTETDTTSQTATYSTITSVWTVTAYSFGTHVVQSFTDTLANNDGSVDTATGTGTTPTDPSGTDTQTAVGTNGDSGTVTLDTLLTGNGQTFTQTQQQVATWTYSSNQASTDVGTMTVGLAAASGITIGLSAPPAASGSETDKNNRYLWSAGAYAAWTKSPKRINVEVAALFANQSGEVASLLNVLKH